MRVWLLDYKTIICSVQVTLGIQSKPHQDSKLHTGLFIHSVLIY